MPVWIWIGSVLDPGSMDSVCIRFCCECRERQLDRTVYRLHKDRIVVLHVLPCLPSDQSVVMFCIVGYCSIMVWIFWVVVKAPLVILCVQGSVLLLYALVFLTWCVLVHGICYSIALVSWVWILLLDFLHRLISWFRFSMRLRNVVCICNYGTNNRNHNDILYLTRVSLSVLSYYVN